MAGWVVVPALEAMRHELNDVFPTRDKTSDGGIGDTSHGARPSGHNPDETGAPEDYDTDDVNEVRARDFDIDLRHPTVRMEHVCQYLLRECRAGRITWIKYLIFNRRIWRASNAWVQETYSGANPHDHHMHVSCRPDTASENTTRPLGLASLLEDDVTPDDIEKIAKRAAALTTDALVKADSTGNTRVGNAVWNQKVDIDVSGTGTNMQPAGGVLRYADFRADRSDKKVDLLSQKVDLVMTKVGATGDELTAFNTREAAEVPPTADANADAVIARLAATGVDELEGVLRGGLDPARRRELAARLALDE